MRIPAIFLLFALLTGLCLANEYEVHLGDKVYSVKEGQPVEVLSPKGEKIRLIVKKKPILFYKDDISFSYSSDMKVTAEKELGVKMITVECENSTLFIAQVYPYKTDPAEVVDTLMGGFVEEYRQLGARVSDKTVPTSRLFANTSKKGKKLTTLMGDLKIETEVFSWYKENKTIALIFQADNEDRTIAERYFGIIANSIR